MHAEAEGVRVRQRVDEIVDERAARAANFAVFAAHRINFPGCIAEHRGNVVGVEAGGVADAAPFAAFLLRVFFGSSAASHAHGSRAGSTANSFPALPSVPPL